MGDILGKIGHHAFEDIIQVNCGQVRKEVSVGPQFGVDVSLVDLPGGMALASTSDPLSLIPSLGLEESAWLSVHLMANDMATTGFAPMYGQFVLNLPATFSKGDFKIYWNHIHRFCADIGVSITGGHTGFIEGQNSTISGGGTFFSVAPRAKMLTSRDAKSGDVILVTKQCAVSSASILVMSFPETVKNKVGVETYRDACALFYNTSSLADALAAVGERSGDVTAMHDVTEGGVLGAIYELAYASGNGAVVYHDQLPIGEVQEQVCSLFSIDPRYCVGAGSMIVTCKKDKVAQVKARLLSEGIPCVAVGELVSKEQGISLVEGNQNKPLEYRDEDPYWAAFFQALKNGWK